MIAIVLAGGYGTRLRTFSRNVPKPLLKVARKPIIDYIFDKLAEVEDIEQVVISTNLSFQRHFRKWLDSDPQRKAEIIADRSYSEEEKPGALASMAQLASGIDDDCLIIAGDNLFTSSLKPMVRIYKDKSCAVVALYDVKDCELAKQYSTATLNAEGRITDFIEKPVGPKTTLIGTCIYILPKSILHRMSEYLLQAADRDNPGRFVGWLCKREPVYGHILDGYWWDIGTIDQYREANRTLQRL